MRRTPARFRAQSQAAAVKREATVAGDHGWLRWIPQSPTDLIDFDDFVENSFGEDRHAKISVDIRDSYTGATRAISLRMPETTADGYVVSKERTLKVKIPKGIKDGQTIRLAGQGTPGIGDGQSGDLYLEVDLKPDKRYRADGADVYLNLPVAPWEAALGAKITVPVPSGDVDLKIPAGSKQGSKLRLKGKGLPAKDKGDFYVILDVVLPPADSDEAKALYKTMSEELAFDPRENF